MSVTQDELQAISVDLVKRHGLDVMALVELADFVGCIAEQVQPQNYSARMAEIGRCIRARMREIGKTDADYTDAAGDFYRARGTIAELNALPE